MEDWEIKYIEERKEQIEVLINEKLNFFEELKNITNKPRIYSIYWRLREIFEDLGHKFKIIQRWSRIDYSNESEKIVLKAIDQKTKYLLKLKLINY